MDLDYFIEELKKKDGTDIHFLPENEEVKVKIRVGRELVSLKNLEKDSYNQLLQRMKIKGGLNISEKRLPQDGIIRIENNEIRLSTLKTIHGEALTLRVFRKRVVSLGDLGFKEDEFKKLLEIIHGNFSLILITGETGSGKSTTMKAILKDLSNDGRKIISLEDPVEMTVPGVMEVNICEDIGLNYERAIFAALRQDPDYISIGEIRDKKTCDSVVKAALSGHSVISTFHSGDYKRTLMRLKTMSSFPEFLDNVLTLVINQKLVDVDGKRSLIAKIETLKD